MEYTATKNGGQFSMTKKIPGGVKEVTLKSEIEALKDGRYCLEIKAIRQVRTVQQNRYYWSCIGMIAEESGYTIEEMEKETKKEIVEALHEQLKERFIGTRILKSKKDRRRRIKIRPTTTKMDTEEFAKYMQKILMLFPYLPSPEDKNLLDFIDKFYPL